MGVSTSSRAQSPAIGRLAPARSRFFGMADAIASEMAKWRSWIEGPIRSDVVNMHFKRMMWREVNSMLEANSTAAESPSAFWDFLWDNYATAQAIAIRRQADVRRDTCSLGRLITEMSGRRIV
jgi:hypothetical protein